MSTISQILKNNPTLNLKFDFLELLWPWNSGWEPLDYPFEFFTCLTPTTQNFYLLFWTIPVARCQGRQRGLMVFALEFYLKGLQFECQQGTFFWNSDHEFGTCNTERGTQIWLEWMCLTTTVLYLFTTL